jgi:hypothetical protein
MILGILIEIYSEKKQFCVGEVLSDAQAKQMTVLKIQYEY